ncbi:hypothetical protein A1O3_01349 [Capronia epimyces CBS 606.96]|uniref:Heterokaryon incompatibility domain-containing protein n=1 Tax=Capronia epimyces CBS 606.96 TaxID=1182542 RepID=W9YU53_9EURO|nr:uncharacterized protein A1O3_01349 [Capronia epimyces CBS 606.96]EXJ92796.1 hypothetical protein A1O3_01349 [Capronia epimyces CBS 606.96]
MQTSMPPSATKRLLHTKTYRLHFDDDPEYKKDPRYAILSHRWLSKEITFDKIEHARLEDNDVESPVKLKVKGACAKAQEHKIQWLWIDSICINKANSVEDQKAITSMFTWYRRASVCYTYLSDVVVPATKAKAVYDVGRGPCPCPFWRAEDPSKPSEWFERGWCLQELLAPNQMEFYDRNWTKMGTRAELAEAIAAITRIKPEYLTGEEDFRKASIAAKMSWMAGRKTSVHEDMAYSMVGIFDITSMATGVSDGMKAFFRLQKEIINTSVLADETIFAWKAPASGLPHTSHPAGDWAQDEWGLLAPSPDCFRDCGDIIPDGEARPRRLDGYKVEREGLKFPFPYTDFVPRREQVLQLCLMPLPWLNIIGFEFWKLADSKRKEFAVRLNCVRKDPNGKWRPVQVNLRRSSTGWKMETLVFRRYNCHQLDLAQKRLKELYSGWTIVGKHRNRMRKKMMTILQPEPDSEEAR